MIICIPSNRPKRLRKNLLNVHERLKEDGIEARVLAVDGSDVEDNKAFAEKLGYSVVSESAFMQQHGFLFQGPYGGPRNVGLAYAVASSEDLVFLDDDVVPLEGFFKQFDFFLQKHAVVVGAYAGRRTGVSFLLDKATRALEDFTNGKLSSEEALRKCREAFSGWSDDWPPSIEGFRGGSLGISLNAARKYCFLPTRFRVEDGLYCELARYFLNEEPFKPFLNEAPVGYHRPERGNVFTLPSYYTDAVQGSSIGLAVKYLLQHFGRGFFPQALDLACAKGPESLLKEFEPEKFQARRKTQKTYDEAISRLGDAQLKKAYEQFVLLSKKDVVLPDLARHVERFFECQAHWLRFSESVDLDLLF